MVTIQTGPVSDPKLANDFLAVQAKLYENDPFNRLLSLSLPETGYLTTLILAYRDHEPVGRMAIIENNQLKSDFERVVAGGFYECENDPKSAKAVLNAGVEMARQKDYRHLVGPLNGDTWHKYRLTLPSDHPPFFLDNYHKAWYHTQWVDNGFKMVDRYVSTLGPIGEIEPVQASFLERMKELGITIAPIQMDRFKSEILDIYHLSLDSFSQNRWYSSISAEQFVKLYEPIEPLMNPEFVLMARDGEGELIGFGFAVPDLLVPERKRLIMKSLAVKPGRKSGGVGSYIVRKTYENAKRSGFKEMVHALMHESNHSTRIMKTEHVVYQTYELMIRPV